MPCGRLGKRLAFDDSSYDAPVDHKRSDGAARDETQSDVGDVLHGATFPRGMFTLIVRHFGQDATWKSDE